MTVVLNIVLRGLTLVSKFGLVFFLAFAFSPRDLGVYGLMVSALSFAVFGLAFEYHYYTRRQLVHADDGTRAVLLRDQMALHVATLVIALPLVAIMARPLFGGWMTPALLAWFVMLLPLELISQELMQGLVAISRPVQANVVLFMRTAAWICPFIAVASLRPNQRTLAALFLWWAVGAVTSIVAASFFLRVGGVPHAVREPIDWRKTLTGIRESLPFIVTTGSSIGLLQLGRFFIEANDGLAAVGVFTFFASLAAALHTLVNSGVPLVRMPRLIKVWGDRDDRRFQRELSEMTVYTAVSAVLLAIVFIVGVGIVLQWVGKGDYEGKLPVFYLLLTGAVLRAQADVPIYALYAQRCDRVLLVAYVMAFMVSLGANLSLVPAFGIRGAAAAELAGSLTLFLTTRLALRHFPGSKRVGGWNSERRADSMPQVTSGTVSIP